MDDGKLGGTKQVILIIMRSHPDPLGLYIDHAVQLLGNKTLASRIKEQFKAFLYPFSAKIKRNFLGSSSFRP
jgi:hypothetical protein